MKKWLVKIEWNTDSNGRWFDPIKEPKVAKESVTFHGFFDTVSEAYEWACDCFPDDTEINDTYVVRYRWWRFFRTCINDPIPLAWWYPNREKTS